MRNAVHCADRNPKFTRDPAHALVPGCQRGADPRRSRRWDPLPSDLAAIFARSLQANLGLLAAPRTFLRDQRGYNHEQTLVARQLRLCVTMKADTRTFQLLQRVERSVEPFAEEL